MEGNKIQTKLVGFKPLKDLVKANTIKKNMTIILKTESY